MPRKTSIEWTDYCWNYIRARNLTTGKIGHHCEHASAGCMAADNRIGCYSEVWNSQRKLGTGLPYTRQSRDQVEVSLDEEVFAEPMPKRPSKIFVCDMSDLFGEWVKDEWLDRSMDKVRATPWIIFQFLTKRPERMRDYLKHRPRDYLNHQPHINLWAGTSIESRRELWRLEDLRATQAGVRFLSLEPLFEDLGTLDLTNIDWVITGAQSGHHAVPMDLDWVRNIRDQCVKANVAFFFKQDATPMGKKLPLPELDGRVWRQFPIA
jgi:protein gp37